MSAKILLLLGAGQNIGLSTVGLYKGQGYKIVCVARTTKPSIEAQSDLCLKADFTNPESLKDVFDQVERKVGIPNVVIYNRELQSGSLAKTT